MQPAPVVRFAPFEVDLVAAELRKRGRKVPLQDQPFKVLALLLQLNTAGIITTIAGHGTVGPGLGCQNLFTTGCPATNLTLDHVSAGLLLTRFF